MRNMEDLPEWLEELGELNPTIARKAQKEITILKAEKEQRQICIGNLKRELPIQEARIIELMDALEEAVRGLEWWNESGSPLVSSADSEKIDELKKILEG